MKLAKLSDKSLAYDNCVYLNPKDLILLGIKQGDKILIDEKLVFKCKADPKLQVHDIGTTTLVWRSLHLTPKTAIGTTVMVESWNNRSDKIAETVSIVVDTYMKVETRVKYDELENYIKHHFINDVFCKDQRFILRWNVHNTIHWLLLLVTNVFQVSTTTDDDYEEEKKIINNNDDDDDYKPKRRRQKRQKPITFGKINDDTNISLMATTNPFMILEGTSGNGGKYAILAAESMEIGGLDSQLGIIFRRAILSRAFPHDIVKQLGIKHVKGILLYGPPYVCVILSTCYCILQIMCMYI